MKLVSAVLLAILLLSVLAGGVAYAGPAYSNARGEFVSTDRNPLAGGTAIVNYAKGAEKWIVSGEVWGLKANTTYNVTLGRGGIWSNYFVTRLVTDSSGAASFHDEATVERTSTGSTRSISDRYDIIRIWYASSRPYLVANEPLGPNHNPETHGLLTFRGEQRGK